LFADSIVIEEFQTESRFLQILFIYQSFIKKLSDSVLTADTLRMMQNKTFQYFSCKVKNWLAEGISPRRLALTLAIGFVIGCIPVAGVPTAACILLAIVLRLNLPVLQAANYLVMPLQWLLMAPFLRMGQWLFRGASGSVQELKFSSLAHLSLHEILAQLTGLAGHALAAWLLIALPAVLLMTEALTRLLRRIPAIALAEAGD
jgi:uncharacterized protein (DUF2062 family)